jgi:hypothetical protein
MRRIAPVCCLVWFLAGCGESSDPVGPDDGLPNELAVSFSRPDVGQALSPAEITAFTRKLTAFWKEVGYWDWMLRTSHGVHASTGKPDYMLWWGVQVRKEGSTVRFFHDDPDGGGHNIMIPGSRVLSAALAGYLLTGDASMAQVAEQYCKGVSATMRGMVFDANDPIDWLMARNIAAFNHTYQTAEGHTKVIDYSGWYTNYQHWNTGRFEYPHNPTWGPVWVTNMRSKDDMPHIFLTVPEMLYAASRAADPAVRAACADSLDLLEKSARDIVDHEYRIRTKDAQGQVFIPGFSGDPQADQAAGDLATLNLYEELIPGAECHAKRAAALIGYDDRRGLDCGTAGTNNYEAMATVAHYYNFAIVRFFHVADLAMSLVKKDGLAARDSLEGMAARLDENLDRPDESLSRSRSEWERDLAQLALRSAAFGLPLTSREARLIHQFWGRGVDEFSAWSYWNLWDAVHPDGTYPHRPGDADGADRWTRIEDMALVLEYCWSPLKNPAGAAFIDCDVVADPARWGQP